MKLIQYILPALILFSFTSNAQVQNNGNLRFHGGAEIGIFGNLTNNGNLSNNLGTLYLTGSNAQVIDGTNTIHLNNLKITKASNNVQVSNEVQIGGELTFITGLILTDTTNSGTEFIHFLDSSIHTGSANVSHIDGVVRKTGNDDFVFPTGDNGFLRTIAISAPANIGDHYTAYYIETNPNGNYCIDSLDIGIDHVSSCEYWILNRTNGSSDVEVTPSWNINSCGVTNLCDLEVARWDGNKWTSEGNGGTTGNTTNGTLVSGTSCGISAVTSGFGPFTLSSITTENPLPVEVHDFTATAVNRVVELDWITVSEYESDYFTVERSSDGENWESILTLNAAGISTVIVNYFGIDESPYSGISYYRIREVDQNGDVWLSESRPVLIEEDMFSDYNVYPNPTRGTIVIRRADINISAVRFHTMEGRDITSLVQTVDENKNYLIVDISSLPSGTYLVSENEHMTRVRKL